MLISQHYCIRLIVIGCKTEFGILKWNILYKRNMLLCEMCCLVTDLPIVRLVIVHTCLCIYDEVHSCCVPSTTVAHIIRWLLATVAPLTLVDGVINLRSGILLSVVDILVLHIDTPA